ncbi:hypothetical protein PRK78_006203 [Emydomyces testavorans]|uniref:Uncharacterized protein n=1 Tax=Emydomyces testavorans TaxID=2070801 RepID=A0AAF0ILF9_9EURO|nr:hypothetical protein PRK78_006203 [Emydomyces testavorans]
MAESSKDDNKSYILFYVLLFGLLLFGLICLQRRQRRPQRDLEADRPLHGGRAGNIYLVPLPPAAIPAQCSCATKVMKLKELDDRFPAVKFRALKRNADGQPEVAHRATCDSSQGEMAMAANDKPELAPGSPHGVKAEPGLSEIQVLSERAAVTDHVTIKPKFKLARLLKPTKDVHRREIHRTYACLYALTIAPPLLHNLMAPLFLIVYHSPFFPAHWSLFVPNPQHPGIGKRIHVEGSVYAGFAHAVQRRYRLEATGRKHSRIEVGELHEDDRLVVQHVDIGGEEVDGDGEDGGGEVQPIDNLEEIAVGVPAPAASLNSVGDGLMPPTKTIQMKNCQGWVIDVVAELVRKGILPETANEVVQNAPKN